VILMGATLALSLCFSSGLITQGFAQPQTEAMRRTRIASAAALARRALQEDSVESWIRIALTTPETDVISTFFETPIENLSRQYEAVGPLRLLLSRNPEALNPAIHFFSTHSSDQLALDRRTEVILAALQPFIRDARVQQLFQSQANHFPLLVGPPLIESGGMTPDSYSNWTPESVARFAQSSYSVRSEWIHELSALTLPVDGLRQLAGLLRVPTPEASELWAAWLDAALTVPQAHSSHLLWPILWSEALQHLERNPDLPRRAETRTQLLRHIEGQLRTRSIALNAEAPLQNDANEEASYLEHLIPDLIQQPFFTEHLARTLEHYAPLGQWRLPLVLILIPQMDRLPGVLQEVVRRDLMRFSLTPRHRLTNFWNRLESLRPHLPPDLRRQLFPESISTGPRTPSIRTAPLPAQLQRFRELAARLRTNLGATSPSAATSDGSSAFHFGF
jgi:hypothetical protein